MKSLVLALAILTCTPAATTPAPQATAHASGFVGVWDGVVPVLTPRRLAISIEESGPGKLSASLRNLDRNAAPTPLVVTTDGERLILRATGVELRFEGRLSADGRRLDLTYFEGPGSRMMTFDRRAEGAQPPAPVRASLAGVPSDAEIRAELQSRVEDQRRGVGIVVGIVDAEGRRRIITYGALNQSGGAAVGPDTVFEIGSITKVVTSLLLTDAVLRGEVSLADPISKYLPPGVQPPVGSGREITLVDLATHTSGLPRLPNNLSPANRADPYADYPPEQLFAYLNGRPLDRGPGARWEYSNLGAALLGQLLARRAGASYETLVQTRVLAPLGMRSTTLAGAVDGLAVATPHSEALAPVPFWNWEGFAPAGALRSTASDMLTLLEAEIGVRQTALSGPMADQLAVRRVTGQAERVQALGWQVQTFANGELAFHNGGSGGSEAFAAFDPKRRVGVVVLSNTANLVEDIGFWVIGGPPPAKLTPPPLPPWRRPSVPLDAEKLLDFIGTFQLSRQVMIRTRVEDGRLIAEVGDRSKGPLVHIGQEAFFLEGEQIALQFRRESSGRVRGVVLSQGGADTYAAIVLPPAEEAQ